MSPSPKKDWKAPAGHWLPGLEILDRAHDRDEELGPCNEEKEASDAPGGGRSDDVEDSEPAGPSRPTKRQKR